MSSDTTNQTRSQDSTEPPTWTYPTRFCRICREDVAPTVTMYPPGVPPRFQRPIVEYKNEDEYGRLIKPCKCTGSMRYIHELCLLRSRTENRREGSMWKCHTCGYKFNFQKLAVQRFLSSKYSSGMLTIATMFVIMFFLGFIADPIINLYVDPYETLLGDQYAWEEVKVRTPGQPAPGFLASWSQHFMKGLVSMGLMGFVKSVLLNPLNWLNLRHTLGINSTRTTTGRDRAANISWIAIVLGMLSAFYFFYQWVQTIIQISLRRVGNNIVDTQLPGDDDDLKPPPEWQREERSANSDANTHAQPDPDTVDKSPPKASMAMHSEEFNAPLTHVNSPPGQLESGMQSKNSLDASPVLVGSVLDDAASTGRSSALDNARSQGWSFAAI